MKLSHVNFSGVRNIGGFSTKHIGAQHGFDMELLPSGAIIIRKAGETTTIVGPAAWDSCEPIETAPVARQDAPRTMEAVPAGEHLNSDGERIQQPLNELMGKPRRKKN